MSRYQKFSHYYKIMGLMMLNTCVLLLLLNAILFVVFQIRDAVSGQERNPVSAQYGNSSLRKVYPDLGEDEINDLLTETWSRPYMYEPFTQFKERPYQGNYVNVDDNGFRVSKNQGSWPPDPDKFNIFLFGGSTTFGYGVPDNQTVASYLQDILSQRLERNVQIYNFGRGFYYSTQERILLEKLLISGFIPDMVIFLDGLNDFSHYNDEPFFTSRLKDFVDIGASPPSSEFELLNRLPMTRVARFLKDRIDEILVNNNDSNVQHELRATDFFNEEIYNDKAVITEVINRYLENKKLIEAVAAIYGVQPVFVWQPIPTYNYDLNYHLFIGDGFDRHGYSRYGYEYFAEFIKEEPLGDNFLWVADTQANLQEPLYVDKVHYSSKMSEMIAATIAELILNRNLLVIDR